MRLVVHLTLPAEARLVPRTRRIFSGYMEELGVDRDTTDDVILALDEACANVIRHAFPGRPQECFTLTAELSPHEVVVVVEDDGVGVPAGVVDGGGVESPDTEAVSGRGLHIIRQLMTSVDLDSGCNGTRLWMRKDLAGAGAGARTPFSGVR